MFEIKKNNRDSRVTNRRRSFLQTLKDVDNLGFLFHKLHFLDNVKTGCARATNVHRDRLHQSTARKVLYLLWHGG